MRDLKWYTVNGKKYAIDLHENGNLTAATIYCMKVEDLLYGFGYDEIGAVRELLNKISNRERI